MHGQMESPNTSPQTIELNPNCLGQAHSNRPGTGYGYKNTEPGCILTVSRVHREARMSSPARFIINSSQLAQTGVLILVSLWYLEVDDRI